MKTAFVRVPLLACLGLLLCLAGCQPAQEASQPGTASDAPFPAASENAASPAASEHTAAPAAFNEIAPPELHVPSTFMTGEDFTPMTEEQMMEYYGVDLPEELLPGLALQPGEYGLYQNEARGVYSDQNVVRYEAPQGDSLTLALGRASWSPVVLTPEGDGLAFTSVNGRQLALFRYTAPNGMRGYYAEVDQGDFVLSLQAEGMGEADFLLCLAALAEPSPDGESSISGRVTAVVTQEANRISVTAPGGAGEDDRGYQVDLPEGLSAGNFALDDLVTVTFSGEAAQIGHIWAGQLLSVEPWSGGEP